MLAHKTEFANHGKLSGKLANSFSWTCQGRRFHTNESRRLAQISRGDGPLARVLLRKLASCFLSILQIALQTLLPGWQSLQSDLPEPRIGKHAVVGPPSRRAIFLA